MEIVVPRNRELSELLSHASSADLNVLADLITDHGKGRVSLDGSIKTIILMKQEQENLQSIADFLESEIRAFGGNTLANFFRSEGISYQELATDVAQKLGGKPSKSDDIFAIEDIVVSQAINKLGKKKIKVETLDTKTLNSYVAQVVGALVATSGTAAGLAAAGGAAEVAGLAGSRLAAAAFPPLTIAAAAATAFMATAPAFRITVPAVLQIAKIRRIRHEADFATYSKELHACL